MTTIITTLAGVFLLLAVLFALAVVVISTTMYFDLKRSQQAYERCIREGWIKGPDA